MKVAFERASRVSPDGVRQVDYAQGEVAEFSDGLAASLISDGSAVAVVIKAETKAPEVKTVKKK